MFRYDWSTTKYPETFQSKYIRMDSSLFNFFLLFLNFDLTVMIYFFIFTGVVLGLLIVIGPAPVKEPFD